MAFGLQRLAQTRRAAAVAWMERHQAALYAAGIAAGAVVGWVVPGAGRLAVLACARFLRDKVAAEAGEGPWAFRPDLVEAALLFAGLAVRD